MSVPAGKVTMDTTSHSGPWLWHGIAGAGERLGFRSTSHGKMLSSKCGPPPTPCLSPHELATTPSRLTPVNVEGPEDDPIAFEDAIEGAAWGLRPGDDGHVGSDGQGPDVLRGLAGHCGGESQRAWLGRNRTMSTCRQDPAARPEGPRVTQVGGPPDSVSLESLGWWLGREASLLPWRFG